ncbi:hypothetical protein [Treponema denticola]|uniref:hypothetical protein n=1 Tax=Treponema denticola TaxID=158 RepID=UPI003D8D688B
MKNKEILHFESPKFGILSGYIENGQGFFNILDLKRILKLEDLNSSIKAGYTLNEFMEFEAIRIKSIHLGKNNLNAFRSWINRLIENNDIKALEGKGEEETMENELTNVYKFKCYNGDVYCVFIDNEFYLLSGVLYKTLGFDTENSMIYYNISNKNIKTALYEGKKNYLVSLNDFLKLIGFLDIINVFQPSGVYTRSILEFVVRRAMPFVVENEAYGRLKSLETVKVYDTNVDNEKLEFIIGDDNRPYFNIKSMDRILKNYKDNTKIDWTMRYLINKCEDYIKEDKNVNWDYIRDNKKGGKKFYNQDAGVEQFVRYDAFLIDAITESGKNQFNEKLGIQRADDLLDIIEDIDNEIRELDTHQADKFILQNIVEREYTIKVDTFKSVQTEATNLETEKINSLKARIENIEIYQHHINNRMKIIEQKI